MADPADEGSNRRGDMLKIYFTDHINNGAYL